MRYLLFLLLIPVVSFAQNAEPPVEYYQLDTLAMMPEHRLQLEQLIDEGILAPVQPGNIDEAILVPYTPGNIDEEIWLEHQNNKIELLLNDSTRIELSREQVDELIKEKGEKE